MITIEEWKPIEDYDGLYEISNMGRVRSISRVTIDKNGNMHSVPSRILKTKARVGKGTIQYAIVALCKNGNIHAQSVHRLVAKAFVPNPDNKPFVDHIDTDPSNNRADNLRWVTQHENALNPLTREHNSRSKKGHKGYLVRHSEETRRKLSEIKRGTVFSDVHREKLSKSKSKYYETPENRKKCGQSVKGKHWKIEGGKRVWY